MSDSGWLPYVGVATGVVGMITGVTGMVISIANYRWVSRMKALDLRLELRTTSNATRSTVEGLPGLIASADESRQRVAAATGGGIQSGNYIHWKNTCTADIAEVEALRARLPESGDDFHTLSPAELESKLVDVPALRDEATSLRDKYNTAFAADDKSREEIRAHNAAIARARMTGQIPG